MNKQVYLASLTGGKFEYFYSLGDAMAYIENESERTSAVKTWYPNDDLKELKVLIYGLRSRNKVFGTIEQVH